MKKYLIFLRELFRPGDGQVQKTHGAGRLITIIGFLVVGGSLWASYAELDQVITAQGKVIPDGRVQTVQHYEGGRIEKIYVTEGDVVRRGDTLLSLSPLQSQSEYNIKKDELGRSAIKLARLDAEYMGKSEISVGSELKTQFPQIFQTEQALFNDRILQFRAQVNQYDSEIEASKSAIRSAKVGMRVAEEELKTMRALVERGLEARLTLIKAEKNYSDAENALLQAQEQQRKSEFARVSFIQQYRSDMLNERNLARAEYSQARETISVSADRADRTVLRSPVSGIVNRVMVTTQGGTISPGADVIEIVPEGSTLVLEAKVMPADIGFLKRGQRALVKFTAYDYSIYGSMKGEVSIVGSDSVQEADGTQHYITIVKIDPILRTTAGAKLDVIPGMQAQVDVITGRRTVADYVFSPITKVIQSSLRER